MCSMVGCSQKKQVTIETAEDLNGLKVGVQGGTTGETWVKENCPDMNCTPFVRQYDILDNKWGASLWQKEYQTNDTRQNLRN